MGQTHSIVHMFCSLRMKYVHGKEVKLFMAKHAVALKKKIIWEHCREASLFMEQRKSVWVNERTNMMILQSSAITKPEGEALDWIKFKEASG